MMLTRSKEEVVKIFSLILLFSILCISIDKFPADDGYFYLQVAKNIIHSNGSTFHGLTITNGYHPLWMIICIIIGYIVGTTPHIFMCSVILFQIALFYISSLLISGILQKTNLKFGKNISFLIMATIFISKGTFLLLETFLAYFMLSASIYYLHKITNKMSKYKNIVAYSTLLGLLILSRLDLVIYVAILMIYITIINYKIDSCIKQTFYKSVCLATPAILIVLLYMLYNVHNFGYYMPVSGWIKSHKPCLRLPYLYEACTIIFSLICIVAIKIRQHILTDNKKYEQLENIITLLALSNIVYLSYILLFTYAAPWYFIQTLVMAALFSAYGYDILLSHLPIRNKGKINIIIISAITTIMFLLAFLKCLTNFSIEFQLLSSQKLKTILYEDRYLLAKELDNDLPPNTNLAVLDTPGILALHTKLNIFPTDGLMNDMQYENDIKQQGAKKYFCSKDIVYILGILPNNSDTSSLIHLGLEVINKNNTYTVNIYTPKHNYNTGSIDVKLAKIYNNPLPNSTSFPKLGLFKIECN